MTPNLTEAEMAERRRVGATITELRKKAGWRADQFANHIGISRPYLSNIEAGRKPITKVLLARIADALDVPQIAIARPELFDQAA
ncbi:helix-turn-helix domain-containing protein [Naumannella halotolerans]|uniref:Helix-turn-helix protein n=1 Tax=Naumannella halotolerans TaxID=993414 RepID=A0A4R7J472_9ACTN|nr:helix-turn-helix transcriptional regulator [Naumannella halotolerans]TDT31139.1 helix-turn-helix protein [Naumannella halotolerans]